MTGMMRLRWQEAYWDRAVCDFKYERKRIGSILNISSRENVKLKATLYRVALFKTVPGVYHKVLRGYNKACNLVTTLTYALYFFSLHLSGSVSNVVVKIQYQLSVFSTFQCRYRAYPPATMIRKNAAMMSCVWELSPENLDATSIALCVMMQGIRLPLL